ncbi:MAG TPA: hypothetical protein VGG74_04395 [Kofleriaceae bacterium]|jgi:hypothetical protein
MTRALAIALCLSTLTIAAAGCETDNAAAATPTSPNQATPHQASTAPDDHAMCVQGLTKARACTDTYIPALVDARASIDHPAGIADAVKQDRDGVIKQAMGEWANDSTDTSIEAACNQMPPFVGADHDAALGCLAQSDCSAYVSCIMPIVTKRL